MRLDELRAQLHTQGDEASATRDHLAMHRLQEVRGRVHRIRRRRNTATAVGAVAAVALVALAVVPLQGERSAPAPASGPAKTAHAERPNPWVWRQTVAGDTLAVGAVGERGRSTLTKTFTPDDNDLTFAGLCDTGSRPGISTGLMMSYSVNGKEQGATGCSESASTTDGSLWWMSDFPARNRARWASMGVRPGEPVTVRLWVENRKHERVERPDLRLGFALYERTGPRIFPDGVMIPRLKDFGGRTYQLTDYTTQPLTPTQGSASLSIPHSDRPRLIMSGLDQRGFPPPSRVQLLVNGHVFSVDSGGGQATDRLHGDAARTLGLREPNDDVRGTLVIAVYELVDSP